MKKILLIGGVIALAFTAIGTAAYHYMFKEKVDKETGEITGFGQPTIIPDPKTDTKAK